MNGFTKLFGTLVTSTIWREDDKTRIVWITMLALADKNGEVGASIPGLAAMANVGVEECQASIERLLGPDKFSRTQDHNGRRIEKIDGGWVILNHGKYRDLGRGIDRTEYLRIKQRESRDRKKRGQAAVSTGVNQDQPISEAEAEAEADYRSEATRPGTLSVDGLLKIWERARSAEFGGLEWTARAGIKTENARTASDFISATVGAAEHVERSMRKFWRSVKDGAIREAKRCARQPALAFACWFSTFPGDVEEFMGAAPAIPEHRDGARSAADSGVWAHMRHEKT